jgi:AraC family transcriptional regulator
MLSGARRVVLGKIAAHPVARGDGWSVHDVRCAYGPGDRPFEERHSAVSIAVVLGGTFQYRSPLGREVMTPGSLLLGNAGECFECGHEHATGDRCMAFRYTPAYFDRLAADGARAFRAPRLPPLAGLARLVAGVATATPDAPWEEIAARVAVAALRLTGSARSTHRPAPAGAVTRVTRSVRSIERDPGQPFTLHHLAAEAGLSPFHYLRTFRRVTGVTPHQFILRARLREAAARLVGERRKVIDVALDAGFGDISNFNRAFRREFGVAPEAYRRG